MILVTGARYSGKRTYIMNALALDENEFDSCAIDEAQELVRSSSVDEALELISDKKIVIVSETGCGVVPLDKEERLYRERAGELAQKLAASADTVVRVVCGLPQLIKGTI